MTASSWDVRPRAKRSGPIIAPTYHLNEASWFTPATPFYLITALPLWWLLGLGYFTFVIAAVPMFFVLATTPNIRIPKVFFWYLMYAGWVVVSLAMPERGLDRYLSWTVRSLIPLAGVILFLYIYNVPSRYLSTKQILTTLGFFFIFTAIVGGYLGLIFGEVRLPTPAWLAIPGSIKRPFVQDIFAPRLAQTQDFLGFPLNRPAMPTSFSNDWAATLVPGTFLAIAARQYLQKRSVGIVIAALAVVPMVVSVNRGLWIGLGLGVAYVVARRLSEGRFKLALQLFFAVVLVVTVVAVSPLGDIVSARAQAEGTTTARSELYSDVIAAVPESPIVGFGAPRANDNPLRPAVGTHGMFWSVLFSQGIPGLIFFVGFLGHLSLTTGRKIRNEKELWLHLAVLTALPTMMFYDHLPFALPMTLIAGAVFMRDRREADLSEAGRSAQAWVS